MLLKTSNIPGISSTRSSPPCPPWTCVSRSRRRRRRRQISTYFYLMSKVLTSRIVFVKKIINNTGSLESPLIAPSAGSKSEVKTTCIKNKKLTLATFFSESVRTCWFSRHIPFTQCSNARTAWNSVKSRALGWGLQRIQEGFIEKTRLYSH